MFYSLKREINEWIIWNNYYFDLYLFVEVVWILTRERNPKPEYIEKARSVIKENGLSLQPLNKTDQSGCENSPGYK